MKAEKGVVCLYRRTVLDNGLTVVSESVPYVRSATIGVWVRAGSRYETDAENGISHFIEHMMFKGTERRDARRIAEDIDAVGGQLNAFTGKESTCYYARVLDEDIPLAVDLLADMLLHSTFDEREIEKEKKVIIEEIKMYEDSPDELVHDLFADAVLGSHPLGRSVLGDAASVQALQRDHLIDYMQRHYTAGNMVVAAAGNVNHDELVSMVADRFGACRQGMSPVIRQIPEPGARRVLRIKDTEQVHLCFGGLGFARGHEDRFVVKVIDTALGGGMSSRLFQELREERALVYTTYSYHAAFAETGIFAIYAGTSPEQALAVLDTVKAEVRRIAEEGVRGEELKRAKAQLKGELLFSLENTANRMSRLAKAELFNLPYLEADALSAKIDAVNEADTVRVASDLFGNPDSWTLAAIGPSLAVLEEKTHA